MFAAMALEYPSACLARCLVTLAPVAAVELDDGDVAVGRVRTHMRFGTYSQSTRGHSIAGQRKPL